MTTTKTETKKDAEPQHTPAERRAWLKANGHDVGDYGRIAAHKHRAYDKAHGLA